LTEDRMKGEHTGIQFGFVPLFYPEFTSVLSFTKELYAPTPASTRDMLGLMFVHDSNVAPQESVHNSLTIFMQEKRLSYFPDCLKVSYYCEDNGLVKATPGNIKHILHYGADKGLLILFNWSDEVAMAELSLNTRELFKTGTDLPLTDAINGEQFSLASGSYNVPIAPRDLRMLEIKK